MAVGNGANSAAFNEGCDARLAGIPLEQCPYNSTDYCAIHWRSGWKDVHSHWGVDARWTVKKLPTLRRVFS